MTHLRLAAYVCGLSLCLQLATACAQVPPEAGSPAATPAPVAAAAAPGNNPDDPYEYLEDEADPKTDAYFRDQAARARDALDRIPGRAKMLERVRALSEASVGVTSLAYGGQRLFYLKLNPRVPSAVLCWREGTAGAEKVLLDPKRYDRGTQRAAIDWISPSPDGRHVAFGVSLGGSEDSVLRVIAVDGGVLPFEIDRARFNTEMAWHPDAHSFYYARLPEGGKGAQRYANARIYRHVIGRATDKDEIVFAAGVGGARDVPEMVVPALHVPLDSKYAYAVVREGLRRDVAVHVTEQKDLAAGHPKWRRIASFADEILDIEGWKDDLYLLSKRNAPRHRVLRMKANAELASAKPFVPEGDSVIRSMGLARDALYLRTMVAGVDRLERMPLSLMSRNPQFVRIPFDNTISELVTNARADGALLRLQGWIDAPQVVQIDKNGDAKRTPVQPPLPPDFAEMDEVRLYTPSHDGARIPVTLFYRKGTQLNSANPTILLGYGSYGQPLTPTFDPARIAWLERGGVIAIAHVRGGGEYGEIWHAGGRRAAKLNTVLDFIAVGEFLSSYGFTNPRKLAVMGTGAGGIPVAGAVVRKPELFAAAVGRAPLVDMLHAEKSAFGRASVPEFGSASARDNAETLRAISAYRQVREGTPYPAVLLVTGLNDARVAPWQAAKMAARLQAASTSGKPVLLRVDADAGHDTVATRAQREELHADVYSFLLWQMGDPQFQPGSVATSTRAAAVQ